MKVNDSSSYMLLELNLNYLFIILKNQVILLFMMYLKSPLIKFGIIDMLMSKNCLCPIFLNMHNQFLFLTWDFFHKMPLE